MELGSFVGFSGVLVRSWACGECVHTGNRIGVGTRYGLISLERL